MVNVKPTGHDRPGKNTAVDTEIHRRTGFALPGTITVAGSAPLSGNWRTGFVLGVFGFKASSAKSKTLLRLCQKGFTIKGFLWGLVCIIPNGKEWRHKADGKAQNGCAWACFSHLNFHQCSLSLLGLLSHKGGGVRDLGWGGLSKNSVPQAMAGGAAQGCARSAVKIKIAAKVCLTLAGHWLGGWRSLSKDPIVNGRCGCGSGGAVPWFSWVLVMALWVYWELTPCVLSPLFSLALPSAEVICLFFRWDPFCSSCYICASDALLCRQVLSAPLCLSPSCLSDLINPFPLVCFY